MTKDQLDKYIDSRCQLFLEKKRISKLEASLGAIRNWASVEHLDGLSYNGLLDVIKQLKHEAERALE